MEFYQSRSFVILYLQSKSEQFWTAQQAFQLLEKGKYKWREIKTVGGKKGKREEGKHKQSDSG